MRLVAKSATIRRETQPVPGQLPIIPAVGAVAVAVSDSHSIPREALEGWPRSRVVSRQ